MVNKRKSANDELPAPGVQPLGTRRPEDLQACAQRTDQHYRAIEFNAGADKKAVLRTIAQALQFPAWFGANLDALYDCLTDLPDRDARGWVIVLRALPQAPHIDADTRAALLDVFRDAADEFATRGVPLRVFYEAAAGD